MIERFIFIVTSPFNLWDYQRFGIELLEQNGFNVELWDLTNILKPELARNYTPPDPSDWPGCRTFYHKDAVINRLRKEHSHTFIMPLLLYSRKTFDIYKAISSGGAEYASLVWAVPFAEDNHSWIKRLIKIKTYGTPIWQKVIDFSFRKFPFKWLGIRPARLILAEGEESLKNISAPTDISTEILWVHSMEYDFYLQERSENLPQKPIAVFLDQYKPFHCDHVAMGIKAPVTAAKYYPLLNNFFKRIEKELSLEVIIAAHPRSNYENHSDYFQGRQCLRNQTIKLVKGSKLVVAHDSIAVNYANLFYKPVIFVTSSELETGWQRSRIKVLAKRFGKKPIFLDKDQAIDWQDQLRVSKSHYDKYRQAYIKKDGTANLPLWQIVADRLKKEL